MEEDGTILAGGTIFAFLIALAVFTVGGIILYLSFKDWKRKKQEVPSSSQDLKN